MEPTSKSRGETLKIVREALELDQDACASVLKVSRSTVYRWESGSNTLPLRKFTNALALLADHAVNGAPRRMVGPK